MVEPRNRHFETSFIPGREFSSAADFNTQFTAWLAIANARLVRITNARPVDRRSADRAAMLPHHRWPQSHGLGSTGSG